MDISSIDAFLSYWKGFRARTRRVAELVPDEHIEWRPREGAFSFGDLLRHLAATERYMFVENVRGGPSRYPGHGVELAEGKPAVLAYLDARHAESLEHLATLTADDLSAKVQTPAGTPITAWKWLRAMVEHEGHHRGQVYLMLGQLDIRPPQLFGLTEEEVQAASSPPAEREPRSRP